MSMLPIMVLLCFIGAGSAFASDSDLQAETSRNRANDDLSGENLAVRQVALEALGTAAGTVVVMDAQTGRIYSIINQDWAIRHAFKPCSTIKLVTGIAGLNEGLIGRDGGLLRGTYNLGLDSALARSNNTYFQKVGVDLGSDKLIYYALRLGLGTPTGINANSESSGQLPYGNQNLRIYSHADDFAVTPLQLAVMVSAITNGGKLVVPQIARTRSEKARFRGFLRRELDITPSVYRRVIPGMVGAADFGTAKVVPNHLNVAGKTGSCISGGTWVGLFASVAPVNDPRYSVVVITKGGSARGRHSAAIAAKIYESLSPTFGRRVEGNLIAKSGVDQGARKADRMKSRIADNEVSSPKIEKTASSRPTGTTPGDSASKKAEPKTVEELFPTIVIVKGKREITRPRVIVNQ